MAGQSQNVVATAWIKIIPTFDGAQQEITEGLTTSLQGVKDAAEETEKKTSKSLDKTFGKMAAGGAIATAITAPVRDIGRSSITSAVEFENTFSYMSSILDNFSGDIDGMKSTAINTAKSTIFSVQDVADAMVVLGKAGLDENNIKGKALQSTLNLAAAAETDLGESADSVVRAMNAFNLTGDDTTRVADALTYSANASTAEVHDLMLGLQQAGSAASVSGWSLEQTVGTLAMFTDSGIKGSDAGTSLKTMLRRLQAPTENAQAAMDALGLQIYDSNGKMVSFESIVGQLESSLSGLTEEERNYALSVIFGSDASRAAMQLMQASTKGLNDYIATEANAGIAQEQATARYSEAGFTIERMNNSIQAAQIALGQALLPAVTVIAEAIAGLASWFGSLPEPVRVVIGVIGALAATLGPVIGLIGSVGLGITTLGPIIAGAAGAFFSLVSPVGTVVAALLVFLTQTEVGNDIIRTIMNALGAFGGIVLQVAGFIGDNLGQAFTFLGQMAGWAVGDIQRFLGDLGSGLSQAASNAQQFMSNAGKAFEDFKTNAGNFLAQAASDAQSKMGEIGQTIKGKLDEAAQGAQNAWSNMSRLAGEFGGQIKEKAISAFLGLAQGIQEKMNSARQLVADAISAIGAIFSGAHFELPHIALPHFNISGSFSLNPISIPHISVDWYKQGGIATKASIVGVGEAGPEAIVPLTGPKFDELTESIAEKIHTNGVVVQVSELVVREEADIDRIANRLAQLTRRKSMTGVYA